MVIPDSLVALPLLAAFAISGVAHYREIGKPNTRSLGWPFVVGLLALLTLCGFLLLIVLDPGWGWRKPAFLAAGLIFIGLAVLVYRRVGSGVFN